MLRKLLIATESIVGLLASFVIGFFPPIVLFVGSIAALSNDEVWLSLLALAGCALSGWLAYRVAQLASRVIERHGSLWPDGDEASLAEEEDELFQLEDPPPQHAAAPLALAMAHELPRLPQLAQAALSLWWLGHFALAVFAGHTSTDWVEGVLNRPSPVTLFLLGVILHFAFLFAANLYLLLAAAVLIPYALVWKSLWNCRFLVDLAIALTSTIAPQFLL